MDKEPKYCAALRDLAQKNGDRHIAVIEGDANSAIKQIANEQKWDRTRAVMFLDPYGMSVDWGTLEAIKATAAIDVWYLVSLSGLFRQAARNASALDRSKRSALTRMLGTEAWQDAWYRRREGVKDLFGDIDEEHSRVADVQAMETFVLQRLRELFPRVLNPLRLNDSRGIPQFALFFAISNPAPKAIGLAQKIAAHMLSAGSSSQVRS